MQVESCLSLFSHADVATATAIGLSLSDYCTANQDVKRAAEVGKIGLLDHFLFHGQFEQRPGTPTYTSDSNRTTRLCLDPWCNIDININGGVRPCCMWQKDTGQIQDGVESVAIQTQELKARLLTGNLPAICNICHIRAKGTPTELITLLKAQGLDRVSKSAIKSMRIHCTSNCNLRCVYCLASGPEYRGEDMEMVTVDSVLAFVDSMSPAERQSCQFHLNGHGETTCHPEWRIIVEKFIGRGLKCDLISNLCIPFKKEELELLSHFETLQVSMDTADPDLLKATRRKVNLSTILQNITLIRLAAMRAGRKGPVFTLSVGLYDKSLYDIENLASLAVIMGVKNINFWNLVPLNFEAAKMVRKLDSMDDDELRIGLVRFQNAQSILRRHDVGIQIDGDFIENLERRTGLKSAPVVT